MVVVRFVESVKLVMNGGGGFQEKGDDGGSRARVW